MNNIIPVSIALPETKVSKRDMNGEKEYFDLPYGWTKQVVYLRNQPSMKGKVRTDIYLTSPGVKGKWIKSDAQLQKYLEENPNVKCDQAVTTTSRKKHREFLEELKKESLTRGISEKSKEINRKRSNLIILESREASSKKIQTEENPLVDKSKSYSHKSFEESEPCHESIIPEEMEEAYNDVSMNDSKVESPRLSELEKLFYAPLVDKSKSYVHKSDEGSEPSHELIIPEEMEEAYNSMTTLLTHTVAHSTKPSFMPKTNI